MYRVGIIIMSDKGSRGEREDLSGAEIRKMLPPELFVVEHYEIIPDEKERIQESLVNSCDKLHLDLVLTSGGTGLASRDVTPEVTGQVIYKLIPGIGEAMRAYGMTKTPRAMLSRGIAGMRGQTMIINLPGSIKGVRESLEAVLPALDHGLATLKGEAGECGQV